MFEEASRDIAAARTAFGRASARRHRVDSLIRAIDALLFELEELNVEGVGRVPPELRSRAADILDRLPPPRSEEEVESRRVRFRVTPMMDVLFDAEETLFSIKHPDRDRLWDEPA